MTEDGRRRGGLRSDIVDVDGYPVVMGQEKLPRERDPKGQRTAVEGAMQGLRPQQKAVLAHYLAQGMHNKALACRNAGYAESAGTKPLDNLLKKKGIVATIENKGIDDERLATVLDEGLRAMHPMRVDQPDHNARVKFLKEANQILDNYPPKKIQVEAKVANLHLTSADVTAINQFNKMRGEKK